MERHSGSKYLRFVQCVPGSEFGPDGLRLSVQVDVYQVIEAWGITNPAQAHALKKVLCAGGRGKGSYEQDLTEAIDALKRAVQINADREADAEHARKAEEDKWRKVVAETVEEHRRANEILKDVTRYHVREAVDSLTVRPDAADLADLKIVSDFAMTRIVQSMNKDAWDQIEKITEQGGSETAPVLQSGEGPTFREAPAPEVHPDDRSRTPGPDDPPVDQQPGRDNAGGRDAPGDYGGRTHRPGPVVQRSGLVDVAPATEADRPKDIADLPPGSPSPWGDPPADRGAAGFKSTAAGH